MLLKENPFYILNVKPSDNKQKIIDRHDEKIFDDDDNQAIYDNAQNILLSPNKRISAEVRWFCDESNNEVDNFINSIEFNAYCNSNFKHNLSKFNALLYNLSFIGKDTLPDAIVTLDSIYAKLNPNEILDIVNNERKKARITEVQDVANIISEINLLRDDFRTVCKLVINDIPKFKYIRFVNEVIQQIDFKYKIGVIIDDFIAAYRLDVNMHIAEIDKYIDEDIKRIKNNPSEENFNLLEENVRKIAAMLRPSYIFDKNIGMLADNNSDKYFYKVRRIAIDFYNEENNVQIALRISEILREAYTGFDEFINKISEDIEYLSSHNYSNVYYEARKAFDEISGAIDNKCYFEIGHEKENLLFYNNEFQRSYKYIIDEFLTRTGYSLEELSILYSSAAYIVRRVANALTWADEFKMAFEVVKIAYDYAIKSRDDECLKSIKNSYDSIEADAANEKSKEYYEAIEKLNSIYDDIQKNCWFENGHDITNKNYYNSVFKSKHENSIKDILKYYNLSGNELEEAYREAAFIYRSIANALTWADEFDLAYKEVTLAYECAKKSNDNDCLESIKKSYDSIRESAIGSSKSSTTSNNTMVSSNANHNSSNSSKSSSNSDNSGCGCLLMFIFIAIGGAIGGPLGAGIGFLIACKMMDE